MLMNLYQYGDVAYVGGAFKTGLHNILEPAAFGLPVIFGPHYSKFPEAAEFIAAGIGFSIYNEVSCRKAFDDINRLNLSEKVASFMIQHTGATEKIFSKIFTE